MGVNHGNSDELVSYLVLWAQSTTEDYIRASNSDEWKTVSLGH